MIGDDLAAERMFGPAPSAEPATMLGTGQAPAPVVEPVAKEPEPVEPPRVARTDAEMEAALFGAEPMPAAELPEGDEARVIRREAAMFTADAEQALPVSLFEGAVGQSVTLDDGTAVQITREHAKQATANVRGWASDLGLSKSEITTIKDWSSRSADRAQAVANRERAVQILNDEHGNDASRALRAAQAYIGMHPKLAAVLNTGAGDDPQTVAIIARKALALHKAGKLRIGGRA